ncbi:hypothetical protein N7453_006382 [Penicillium expansum]|nr:hypothetical protein N7453_006382 [Penicillium expansum]
MDIKAFAIQQFFNRTWFQRVWVIQEFVLVKNVRYYADLTSSSTGVFGLFCMVFSTSQSAQQNEFPTSLILEDSRASARLYGAGELYIYTLTGIDIRVATSGPLLDQC